MSGSSSVGSAPCVFTSNNKDRSRLFLNVLKCSRLHGFVFCFCVSSDSVDSHTTLCLLQTGYIDGPVLSTFRTTLVLLPSVMEYVQYSFIAVGLALLIGGVLLHHKAKVKLLFLTVFNCTQHVPHVLPETDTSASVTGLTPVQAAACLSGVMFKPKRMLLNLNLKVVHSSAAVG